MQLECDAILKKPLLTERELLTLARRVRNNGAKMNYKDDGFYLLTPEQNQKGIDWCRDQWKTARGIERKNNPFGSRETYAIEHFDHFVFQEFYRGGSYEHQISPLYGLFYKDPEDGKVKFGFEYYLWVGEIKIVG